MFPQETGEKQNHPLRTIYILLFILKSLLPSEVKIIQDLFSLPPSLT